MNEKSIDFNLAEEDESKDVVLPSKNNNNLDLTPKYGSTDWHDYVMSLLTEDEKPKGNPTVAGLRRIVEDLLGEILFTGPTEVFPATTVDGVGRATVLYEIVFAWKMGVESYVDLHSFEYPQKVFRDVGEAWSGNTPPPFDMHASATATSRAEGRVLRKALKLKVATAEEVNSLSNNNEFSPLVDENASSFQKNFIVNKCKLLNINLEKFVGKDYNKLTHIEAVGLLEKLNNFMKDNNSIPKEIKL